MDDTGASADAQEAAKGGRKCQPVAVMDDGWSEWIHPLPGYLMQCCDCGLIHEMEAAIGLSSGGDNGPRNEGETKRRVVIFRMRRAVPERQTPNPSRQDTSPSSKDET
jgi:hypothetical protein